MTNKITVILGRKGSGKTYLANKLSLGYTKIVICDPLNDYIGGHIFSTFPEFESQFNDLYFRDSFRVIAKFTTDDDFDQLFTFLFNYRNFAILIDETDMFAAYNSVLPSVKRLISYGRHRSIDLIMISRRPYELNRLVTSQADLIITFKQTEKRDIDFMATLGIDPGQVAGLEKYKFIEKDNT